MLEEYDAAPAPVAGELYLDGLYLLDPFYQAAREGLASGFYHLEEVAPDHFSQTDYYLNYLRTMCSWMKCSFCCRCRMACCRYL